MGATMPPIPSLLHTLPRGVARDCGARGKKHKKRLFTVSEYLKCCYCFVFLCSREARKNFETPGGVPGGALTKEVPSSRGALLQGHSPPGGALIQGCPHRGGALIQGAPSSLDALIEEAPSFRGALIRGAPSSRGTLIQGRPHRGGALIKGQRAPSSPFSRFFFLFF